MTQAKGFQRYRLVMLFILLCKVVLNFETVDEILNCDYSKALKRILMWQC